MNNNNPIVPPANSLVRICDLNSHNWATFVVVVVVVVVTIIILFTHTLYVSDSRFSNSVCIYNTYAEHTVSCSLSINKWTWNGWAQNAMDVPWAYNFILTENNWLFHCMVLDKKKSAYGLSKQTTNLWSNGKISDGYVAKQSRGGPPQVDIRLMYSTDDSNISQPEM